MQSADRQVYDSAYFVECVPLGSSSFALRSLSSLTKEHTLGKETTYPSGVMFANNLLQKQIDGIFCIDGSLQYNGDLTQIIYTYYYRNQFIVMDTNLNLIYRGNTIDTTTKAKIQVETIRSNNTRMMSTPPMMVNRLATTSDKFLFVNSKLMARNESKEAFDIASVIDVYDLRKRTYQFSFYIYDFNKEKMQNFKVVGNNLLVLYDHFLVIYELRATYFSQATS